MGALMLALCALFMFFRGGTRVRLLALFSPGAVMDFVSRFQPVISRKLFFLAGLFGGLRTDFERYRGALPPAFLIAANHQSLADIPALAVAFSRHGLRYVAKKSLGRGIPYVSVSLRLGLHALISRTGDYRKGQRAMRRLAALSHDGICPVVFPEGTRARDGRVHGFFAGAVRVILENEPLPVLSVAVDGGHRIATVPRLMLHMRRTLYRVRPLTLYPAPRGKREIMALLSKVEAEIRAQIGAWRRGEEKRLRP